MRMRALAVVSVLLTIVSGAVAQTVDQRILDSVRWREIGPYRGGRSCAVSGVYDKPDHFYMGVTGGGVWKTTDAGENWECVSDGFFKTGSVGAIAVSRSNPKVVYVGMGETEVRGNISHGDGMYKSDDEGKTWRHIGLKATQSIARVRVHPKDENTVWVAALGHVYGPNRDRGVFKSTDGGQTWRKTLYVSDRAGACDLSVDVNNPDVIYAATWEVFRTPYSLSSGGPGSKLFKSTDGGENWTDISKNPGMPIGLLGKIGVSVSPADSNRVYVMLENEKGGLYVSDDAGASFELVNGSSGPRQRPWYYTRLQADPKAKDTVYIMNVAYHKSTDGGKTLRSGSARHSDHHDIWIDPSDNSRIIMANDGGASVSTNTGASWSDQDYPTAQFYHVSTDNAFPYNILGAQQDNSTVRIPSRTRGSGITSEDWTSTAGGESGYVTAHPLDPDLVFGGSYGGTMGLVHHRLNYRRSVDPWPENPMGDGAAKLVHRMQWTFPIVFSPHDPNVMYVSSQHVMRSRDNGASWEVISPDLTTNDKSKQQSSGGPITKDNTSVEYYCTVFTLAESPRTRGVIWAGTDDGLVHVTRDNGRTWKNVTPTGMPEFPLISMVDVSRFVSGKAYIAVDNHENDDLAPYIYKTTDFGQTWTKIINGLPSDSYVRVVREDPDKEGVLYAGLETGVWVSHDDGQSWRPLQGNLPVVPIHDLVIKEGDLVVATHGRSFWVLDDLSAVREANQPKAGAVQLFSPRPAYQVRFGSVGTGPVGKNPDSNGPTVMYWAESDIADVTFEVVDQAGTVVASGKQSAKAGMNSFSFLPRYPTFEGFPGMRMWAAGRSPLKAPPGVYKVKVIAGSQQLEASIRLLRDPRVPSTDADLVEQLRFSQEIAAATTEANNAYMKVRAWQKAIDEAVAGDADLEKRGADAKAKLDEIADAIFQSKAESGQDFLNYPIRLNNKLASLIGTVQSGDFGPTKQSRDVYKHLKAQLDVELRKLRDWETAGVSAFNEALRTKGRAPLKLQFKPLGSGGSDSDGGSQPDYRLAS
ncbi:hypothetical protein QPK87_20050 [Kamptonema cortianum]|nr:hypothetical protein [Geitlerinema splendidum]MDK3158852.1 hypothetical protein [Kamptonema cortianum]